MLKCVPKIERLLLLCVEGRSYSSRSVSFRKSIGCLSIVDGIGASATKKDPPIVDGVMVKMWTLEGVRA